MPDLKRLDGQRDFTHDQRIAIWRRDKGICQGKLQCDGVKCEWDEWEADHRTPWSRGGPTTMENGQVLCVECNRARNEMADQINREALGQQAAKRGQAYERDRAASETARDLQEGQLERLKQFRTDPERDWKLTAGPLTTLIWILALAAIVVGIVTAGSLLTQ